jgi:hypothetical protein
VASTVAPTPAQPPAPVNPAIQWILSPVGAAFVLAAAFGIVGAIVLLTVGPVGAITPAQVAAAPNSTVHFAGRIEASWVDGNGSTTHFQFVGAPSLDVRVPGNVLGRFPRGSFVEVSGLKEDQNLTVHSISVAREPLSSAVPFVALASGLTAGLATHFLLARFAPGDSPLATLAAGLRARRSQPTADDE